MIIEQGIRVVGSKGAKELTALFDSGSTYSFIRKDIAEKIEIIIKLPEPLELRTEDKNNQMEIEKAIRLDFHLNGYRFTDEFMVSDKISEECIIGAGTMQKWHFKLDFENEKIIIDPRATRLKAIL